MLFENQGYIVDTAEDGEQAFQMFKQYEYDLIVTDIIMPEKEGVYTIQDIRRFDKNIPIIAFSGGGRLGPESYLPASKMLGADYCFAKPVDNDELLNTIKKCLSQKS